MRLQSGFNNLKIMLKKHLVSYKYAMRGIWLAFRYEPNMIIHLIATIAVLILNSLLEVSRTEWLITLALIGVVLMSEIFNTALEKLANRVTQDQDPMIGQAKDLAAGAVLIIGIAAVICAVIIYWPYLS
jgi:diacylglycerol kinase